MWPITALRNKLFSSHPSPPCPEYDKPWRSVNWCCESKQNLLEKLNNLPGNFEGRILLYGPVGAGKSSFINSVDSVLQGRITTRALADSTGFKSFTVKCKTYKLRKGTTDSCYPFTFIDIMGIEHIGGIQTDDIIQILHGHINKDYTFNPVQPISDNGPEYIKAPSLKDKIHCLVAVISAATASQIDGEVINKMRYVREQARLFDIPQAIIMTKVDEASQLEKVYNSKKIKEKMEECSCRLGVPMNCIFPVKNYHNEHTTDTATDILILDALLNIVNFARDYVEDKLDDEKSS